ncbi:hypothetical protein EGT50_14890 [Rhodococcus xishaensis]|uniref:Uncharacterized protein n=1 Tax=Rhodococcus xishaensis TaxID=2487364 RepID=A0A438AQ61_9NOCA|nr:hypothetical protein EGT50_14890 [Rhodococcus xishaensis]
MEFPLAVLDVISIGPTWSSAPKKGDVRWSGMKQGSIRRTNEAPLTRAVERTPIPIGNNAAPVSMMSSPSTRGPQVRPLLRELYTGRADTLEAPLDGAVAADLRWSAVAGMSVDISYRVM